MRWRKPERSNPVRSPIQPSLIVHSDLAKLPQPVAALVQTGLKSLGYYQGSTMGIPGDQTAAAYQKYLDHAAGRKPVAETPAATVSLAVLREAFVEIAREKIGVTEEGGNNRGAMVQQFQAAASWLPGTGWAWCAAYVGWCFDRLAERYRLPFATPEGAGAFWYEDWAKEQGIKVLSSSSSVIRGDLLIYEFSHIDIATQSEIAGRYCSVGGNTNAANSRDGDGVWEKPKTKKTARIRSIIRPFP